MKIKKGQMLLVTHSRKGTFKGIAQEDFDTKKEECYPVCVVESYVQGISMGWVEGEEIPCRASLCSVEVVK